MHNLTNPMAVTLTNNTVDEKEEENSDQIYANASQNQYAIPIFYNFLLNVPLI